MTVKVSVVSSPESRVTSLESTTVPFTRSSTFSSPLTVPVFATSTVISWSYYGDRAAQYLFGDKAVTPYRYIYVVVLFIGAIAKLESVWGFGDFAIALMTIPNLIAIIALSGIVSKITKEYFSREHLPYKHK